MPRLSSSDWKGKGILRECGNVRHSERIGTQMEPPSPPSHLSLNENNLRGNNNGMNSQAQLIDGRYSSFEELEEDNIDEGVYGYDEVRPIEELLWPPELLHNVDATFYERDNATNFHAEDGFYFMNTTSIEDEEIFMSGIKDVEREMSEVAGDMEEGRSGERKEASKGR